MNIGTVEGVLKLRDEFSKEIAKVRGELDRLQNKTDKASKKTKGLSSTMTLLKAAIPVATLAAFGRELQQLVMAAGRFDSALNQSLAIMGDVSSVLRDDMAAAARRMALETTFSAEEAAQSYFFLASAGLDAKASIAALPVVSKFAQAGMFDMALATDLLTDAQSALGLTIRNDAIANMENMVRVSDVLVKANVLANAKVQEFSTSLTREAGAALKSFNIEVEEGVAVLAAFADQGVKGEQAGTSLARVLRLMIKAAIDHADTYREMGVQVFDASNNMRNMADIVGDLEKALSGLAPKQKAVALEALGFEARLQGVILPLLGTSEAIRAYEKELRSAGGTTQQVADKQLESFESQLKLTKNAIDDLKIAIGTDMLPALREALETIRDVVFVVKLLREELKKLIDDNPRLALFFETLSRAAFGAGGEKLLRQFADLIRKQRELAEEAAKGTEELTEEEKVRKAIADAVRKQQETITRLAAADKKFKAEQKAAAEEAAEKAKEVEEALLDVAAAAREGQQAMQEMWDDGMARADEFAAAAREAQQEMQRQWDEGIRRADDVDREIREGQAEMWRQWQEGLDDATKDWDDAWESMAASALRALDAILRGGQELADVLPNLFSDIGAAGFQMIPGFGESPLAPILGGIAGGLFGDLLADLLGGSKGVAGQNVGVVGGELQATIDRRANKKGDLDALDAFLTDALDFINGLFDDLGIELGKLNSTFDLMVDSEKGLIVNINGLQKAFGEDFEAALAFLVQELVKNAEFANLGAEATAAIKQASAEAGDNLEQFASDAADIMTILAASGPQIPEAIAALRDEMVEAQRLAAQAQRFGLDASGLLEQMNQSIQSMADSFSRTSLLAAIPTGQGVDAIRDYFNNVVRPAVFAFNALMREMGRPENQINLADIDAIQRGAVADERRRQQEEQQAAFDRANETVQDTTRGFLELAGQLDPFDEQLRQQAERYQEAMAAAEAQGISTEGLTEAYNAATAAIEANREAAEEAARQAEAEAKRRKAEARVQARLSARGTRADFWQFAAGLFDQMGQTEKAARARALAEYLNLKIGLEQQRLAIIALAAQGRNVDAMQAAWDELADFVNGLDPDDLMNAGDDFRQSVSSAARELRQSISDSIANLHDLLGMGGAADGGVFDDILAPYREFLDSLKKMNFDELGAIRDELLRLGLVTQQQINEAWLKAGGNINKQMEILLGDVFDPIIREKLQAALEDLLEPVGDFLDEIRVGKFGGNTPQQSLDEARRQFQDVVQRILSGDTSAIGEFAGTGQTLLEIARQMFGSSAEFQRIREFILSQGQMVEGLDVEDFIDPVAAASEQRHSEWEQSFAEMQQTSDTLKRILGQLESGHDESSRLLSQQNQSLGHIRTGLDQDARARALAASELRRLATVQRERERDRAA